MARPKRLPYENLDHSKKLQTAEPFAWNEYQEGKLCPKVNGFWRWVCDSNTCTAGPNGDDFFYIPEKCGRRRCIICSSAGDKKRGKGLLERLGGRGIGIWVFTLPRPWDSMLSGPALKELEKRFRARLEHIYMARYGVRIGYRQLWHPSGDKCSACGYEEPTRHKAHLSSLPHCPKCGTKQEPHPHMNFVVPLQGWDVTRPDHIANPVMRKLPASITMGMLREVKEAWAEEVSRCFAAHPHLKLPPMVVRTSENESDGLAEDIKNGKICIANCHYQFVKQPTSADGVNQMKHRLSYFARAFPAWEESFKTVLHRGRDYGLLTSVSRGNTKLGRDKYRESILFEELENMLSDEEIERLDEKPLCPLCSEGRLHEVDYQPKFRAKWGIRISGPYHSRGSPPTMEISQWPKMPRKMRLLSVKAG